jgi:hypothetical protein
MPLKNACFISYRSGQKPFIRDFIDDLEEGLASELEALTPGKGVFVDRKRLGPGEIFDEALAGELCRSACMILVYTANYFDTVRTYPAREYFGMVKLESERFRRGQGALPASKGFIVPVVLRSGGRMPHALKSTRNYEDLDAMALVGARISQHAEYGARMKRIAQYAYERCCELESAPGIFDICEQFVLPSDEEIRDELAGMIPQQEAFPGGLPVSRLGIT